MIKINDLIVKYKDFKALDIPNLEIASGEKIGIIGSNGAGKTTLIKAILGIIKHQGKVSTKIPKESISVHLQFNNYSDNASIKEIIEMIIGEKISSNLRIKELIQYFEFENFLNKKFKSLSGGQKQRLTLILVLYQNSPISIFDEVTSGLDFETRQKLMFKIKEWCQETGATVLLVSHYYEELYQLVDKILLLDKGLVLTFGSIPELFNKYCGYSVILVNNKTLPFELSDERKLAAPINTTAIKCENLEEELEIVNLCSRHQLDYRRVQEDIELIVLNVKKEESK